MEIRVIKAVFVNSEEIKPIGKTLENKIGMYIKCPSCNDGILFVEFESRKTKCTQCDYEK